MDMESANCFRGCVPGGFSPGCDNCLAATAATRSSGHLLSPYAGLIECGQWTGKLDYDHEVLEHKAKRRSPTTFMVSYMGEVALHSPENIGRALEVMVNTPRHTWVWLTKLPKELRKKFNAAMKLIGIKELPKNIAVAVSVENTEALWRVRELRKFKCHRKEVWFKPLLEKIRGKFSLRGVHTVRISEEKGRGKKIRPLEISWITRICRVATRDGVQVIKHQYSLRRDLRNKWKKEWEEIAPHAENQYQISD